MKTLAELLKIESEIIKNAEQHAIKDDYYLNLLELKDTHSALAYKYVMVTMNLAMQIKSLTKQLKK
jgi:hypothetical protein